MERIESVYNHICATQKSPSLSNENSLEYYKKLSSLINPEELKKSFNGKYHEKIEENLEKLENISEFQTHHDGMEMTRPELRRHSITLLNLLKKNLGVNSRELYSSFNTNVVALQDAMSFDCGIFVKNYAHLTLVGSCLQSLGTEKHEQILKDCYDYKTIGSFALTELGHGSNAQGIRTEAHYDSKTQEFVLKTPDELAMKIWISSAKDLGDMCIVFAQLYIGENHYGPHAFVVPIRDRKNHQVFTGITIGDCGAKMGNVILLCKIRTSLTMDS